MVGRKGIRSTSSGGLALPQIINLLPASYDPSQVARLVPRSPRN